MTRQAHNQGYQADPQWYKDAVIYELRVRSFCDTKGDGVGDFRGLIEKLDYIQSLGVTAVWLLPFYPSPLRDDGYDIADYLSVHPEVGDLTDFKEFLAQAHKRDLRVITELVLNHTSDQHPWFQRARTAPLGSVERDFYVWAEAPNRYLEARVIFSDFESSNWTWDPVVKSYFWHRFYSHQPDLNYDNPVVRAEILKVVDFWLQLGVDGLRLDAVPYLFEREGTSCENLDETLAFLGELRRHVDKRFRGRMLLAEANQWPEEAIKYLGPGKCHMAFHFPVMTRMYLALQLEDRFPLVDILEQTPPLDERSQWAVFLRNHDELTLEMVSEEERETLLRAYAPERRMRVNAGIRRRLAPLANNNRRRIDLLHALLMSLPGTPVLYYGDEIGMGDNIYLNDRDGLRTPMQWNADRNAGFSAAGAQRLILPVVTEPGYHYESVNVESQERDPESLLWWMRRMLALRRTNKAFGRGGFEVVPCENHRILAFIRRHERQAVLAVFNLSRFPQWAELDLACFSGMMPVEMFNREAFPRVEDRPWRLMLSGHGFYWFDLSAQNQAAPISLGVGSAFFRGSREAFMQGRGWPLLAASLPAYLGRRMWIGELANGPAAIKDAIPIAAASGAVWLVNAEVEAMEGWVGSHWITVGAEPVSETTRSILHVKPADGDKEGFDLVEADTDSTVAQAVTRSILQAGQIKGHHGSMVGVPVKEFQNTPFDLGKPVVFRAEQRNTLVGFGQDLMLKMYRSSEPGPGPEVEVGLALGRAGYANAPKLVGHLEYRPPTGVSSVVAVLHRWVTNHGDGWLQAREELKRYYERALSAGECPQPIVMKSCLDLLGRRPEGQMEAVLGPQLEWAALLGRRCAQLHQALSSDELGPDFSPEPYLAHHQRSVYQGLRAKTGRSFRLLKQNLGQLPAQNRVVVADLLGKSSAVVNTFNVFKGRRLTGARIRCHGDLHLGRVLCSSRDVYFTGFEGEVARSLEERRRKRSPLRDLAGLLRSFSTAAEGLAAEWEDRGTLGARELVQIGPWAQAWSLWSSAACLEAYVETAGQGRLMPKQTGELEQLLKAFLVEKAIDEIEYCLTHRPVWVMVPIRFLARQVMEKSNT